MGYVNKKNKTGILASIKEFIVLLLIVFLIRTWGFGLYQVPTGSMETTMLVGERFFADKLSYVFRAPSREEIIAFNDPTYQYSDSMFTQLFQRYVWGPSNWTKRVIGIPGDLIQGAIEDNKAVIYRNGQKLHETYLNKYPLVLVWKEDPEKLRAMLEADIATMVRSGIIDQHTIDTMIEQKFGNMRSPKSYDPNMPFDQQPFYRISPDRVVRNTNGELELIKPETILYPRNAQEALARIEQKKNYWDGSDVFYIQLGAGEYWCMGDNRLGSRDCRSFGPIQGKQIHGRIVFRIWSIDSDESWWILDLIKHPIDFWSRVRWSRFFQRVS